MSSCIFCPGAGARQSWSTATFIPIVCHPALSPPHTHTTPTLGHQAEILEAYVGKEVTLVHNGPRLVEAKPEKLGKFSKKWIEQHGGKVRPPGHLHCTGAGALGVKSSMH